MTSTRTKLVERAATAVSRGRYERALAAYEELESIDGRDGAWPRRCGEMLRHQGRKTEALAAFDRCVEKYALAGFLVKAIAVCKLILRVDAGHMNAKRRLEELTEQRFQKPSRRAFGDRKPSIPSGKPVEEVSLKSLVPGAVANKDDERITLIPIDEPDGQEFAAEVDDELSQALRETALFESLAATDLDALLDAVILRQVGKGEVIFRQGDAGAELYVIDEGEVRVVGELPDGSRVELGLLGEGDFFGEVALVAETPRTATVEAATECELLVLGREAISTLVEREPSVLTMLLRFVRDRLFGRLTSSHQLLASFSESERRALAARFELLEVEEGATLIREGERSPGLFVVLAGKLAVTRGEIEIARLGVGAVSGEMSLLTGEGAIATVSAATRGLLVRLPGAEFRELIMTHPQVLAYIGELVSARQQLISRLDSNEESNPESLGNQQLGLV